MSSGVPSIPSNAPFNRDQRAWLNGYLAGRFAFAAGDESVEERPRQQAGDQPKQGMPLLVLFGSQTGTAEGVAKRLAAEAESRHYTPRVMEMNAFAPADLTKVERLLMVTSTWGDGDPPDNAVVFCEHLNSTSAPRLDHLLYSVLALGDRSYANFCGAGKKLDERLEQLGARRIHPRADCDVDYQSTANVWMQGLWAALAKTATGESKMAPGSAAAEPPALSARLSPPPPAPVTTHDRNSPFPARLIGNRKLNRSGSTKDTRHFEISLAGSALKYEVGDALGIWPTNCPGLVEQILAALGCDGEEAVKDPLGNETSLAHALLHSYTITQPTRALCEAVAERSGDAGLKALLDPANQSALADLLRRREVVDLLLEFPKARFAPAEFVGLLGRLSPRLYSIASSPRAHSGEVHLTVAVVRYESEGRPRKGVCSTFLAERVEADSPVPVFVRSAPNFRLPGAADRPIIMIGPGTGIAPFRAFLEERHALGAPGRSWLFFGDQRQTCDFLYREELEAMMAEGVLTRLDTAFSRDQPQKIYVQHRLLEHAREVWQWLEDGAHVYVCGDARRMARDVDAALHELIQSAGGKTAAQAADYVQKLKTANRYQRDVY